MSLEVCNSDHDDVAYNDGDGCPACAALETRDSAKKNVDEVVTSLRSLYNQMEEALEKTKPVNLFDQLRAKVDPSTALYQLIGAVESQAEGMNEIARKLNVQVALDTNTEEVVEDPDRYRKLERLISKLEDEINDLDNIDWD
jgi:DNA repair ATPase RecN